MAGAPLQVFAAASLADVLAPIVADFTTTAGEPAPQVVADASSRLATQIRAGAPADVFFSADVEWMDTLVADGLVVEDTRRDLLGNRLVVVVPKASGVTIAGLDELARLDRLALAGAAVPAGKYARAALAEVDVLAQLTDRIVEADNVRTALAWVARGEVPAGIVYATDAAVEPAVRVALEIPERMHPEIVYPIAALRGAADPARARAFVEHCRGTTAADRFRAAGFTVL